ncbi:YqgE/AlgH family protein [Brevundimonas sp. 2R-24]|uniref:UPF0301 protein Q0812_01240 n=1 Tax=Peiella sedimenti TaxID=3061083 RepID=A0ABT8SHX2_9CAUL|nr:YqgE/AlgH family protein [Caulobacteraceae bacterium XZ-24]
MSEFNSLAGRLLIAMPGIGDPRFEHAVILICAHGPDHAMGLRLNMPREGLALADVLDRMDMPAPDGAERTRVLDGGPVDTERGFVLHSDDIRINDASLTVVGGVELTATREILAALSDPAIAPRKAVLALGYAGWDKGQLESELRDNVWLVADADETLIFDQDLDRKWEKALKTLGVDPAFIAQTGGTA